MKIFGYTIIKDDELQARIDTAVNAEKQKGKFNLENLRTVSHYLLARMKKAEEEVEYYKSSTAQFIKGEK